MVALREVVCFAVLAVAAANVVQQCPGAAPKTQNADEHVQLSCKKSPCALKRGTETHVSVAFTPERDVSSVKNAVSANIAGIPFPFIGVDGNSICDKIFLDNGEKTSCPLKAGTNYIYKDSFPVLDFYPTIRLTVHWALKDGDKDLLCFEVPARIK